MITTNLISLAENTEAEKLVQSVANDLIKVITKNYTEDLHNYKISDFYFEQEKKGNKVIVKSIIANEYFNIYEYEYDGELISDDKLTNCVFIIFLSYYQINTRLKDKTYIELLAETLFEITVDTVISKCKGVPKLKINDISIHKDMKRKNLCLEIAINDKLLTVLYEIEPFKIHSLNTDYLEMLVFNEYRKMKTQEETQ